MTPEEAAEIVLRNDPWEKCPKSESEDHPSDCECDLSGAVLKADYKQAYALLGRPPPPIWTTVKLPNGGTRISGPAVYVGKFPVVRKLIPLSRGTWELDNGSSKKPKTDP